jgi:hypothetical protein
MGTCAQSLENKFSNSSSKKEDGEQRLEGSKPVLTLIQPGSGKSFNYWVHSALTLLSLDANLPLPVFGRCVIERYGFGNMPRIVQQHQYN